MLKNSARLMHISSDESDGEPQTQSIKADPLRISEYKFDSCKLEPGFFYQNPEQPEYSLTDSVTEQASFPIINAQSTILKPKDKKQKQKNKTKKQQNLIALTESHIENSGDVLRSTKDRKNILDIDLVQEEDSSDLEDLVVKVDSEEEEQSYDDSSEEVTHNEGEQNSGEMILKSTSIGVETDGNHKVEDKVFFIKKPLKYNQKLQIYLQRLDSGVNYFLPQLDCIFMSDFCHIVSAKKKLTTYFEYAISCTRDNFQTSAAGYLGKVAGDFTNNTFNTFLEGEDKSQPYSIILTTRYLEDAESKMVSPLNYEVYVLDQKYSYWELEGIEDSKVAIKNLIDLYQNNQDKIAYYRNKKPEFLQECQSYMLNFGGRVSKGSVKNFIIEDKNGKQVLMFGKGNADLFNAYISHPFTPLQALGIIIPQFSTRIFVK